MKKFLIHFVFWLLGLPVVVAIVFAPLILALITNNAWWLCGYFLIFAIALAIRTYDL